MAGFVNRWTQTLARHFQQAEARNAADLDAGAVDIGGIHQTLLDVFAVTCHTHINEINNNQAAQIAQTQLAGNFIGRFEIGLVRGFFNITALGCFRGVDINGYKRFGVINHQFSARWQLDIALVSGFYLSFNLVAGEKGNIVVIEFQLAEVIGHDHFHEFAGLLENTLVINENLANIRAQVIAQRADNDIAFLVNQALRRRFFVAVADCIPELQKKIEIPLQFFLRTPDTGSTHDNPHIVGRI